MATRRQPAWPTFFVIGASKCGTTSLHRYLDLHPEIGMAREKEPHYFTGGRGFARGERWYRSQFDASYEVRGESSVGYSLAPHRSGVPARIKAVVPDARFIFAIRDPIARFLSDHTHQMSDGHETRSVDDAALEVEGSLAGDRGRYHYQIRQYMEHFDRNRLHVVIAERLAGQRRRTLSDVFLSLGVDEGFWSPDFERVLHESRHFRKKGTIGQLLRRLGDSRLLAAIPADTRREIGKVVYQPFTRTLERPVLGPAAREHLASYYRDDVAALREFLDDPLDEWSL